MRISHSLSAARMAVSHFEKAFSDKFGRLFFVRQDLEGIAEEFGTRCTRLAS